MGLSSGLCCKSCGAYEGACPWCKIVGIRAHNCTRYPGSIRQQSTLSALGRRKRAEYEAAFPLNAQLQEVARLPRPQERTSREAFVSGLRVSSARLERSNVEYEAIAREEAFLDVSVWATDLPNWENDLLRRSMVDSAHCLQHLMIDSLSIVGQKLLTKSNMKFTRKRREEEKAYGRFLEEKEVYIFLLFYFILF